MSTNEFWTPAFAGVTDTNTFCDVVALVCLPTYCTNMTGTWSDHYQLVMLKGEAGEIEKISGLYSVLLDHNEGTKVQLILGPDRSRLTSTGKWTKIKELNLLKRIRKQMSNLLIKAGEKKGNLHPIADCCRFDRAP